MSCRRHAPARSRSAEGFHDLISKKAKLSGPCPQHHGTFFPLSAFNFGLSTSFMKDAPGTRDYDWWLLAILAAICALGVMEIYSTTHGSSLAGMQTKQERLLVIGFVFVFVLFLPDFHLILDQF